MKGENQEIDIEELMQNFAKEDADESHQNNFDNEFYEDVFLPYYWKNPFIEGFYQSSGDPGSEEFFNSFIRYFDPITGELCEIQFASYPNNFKKYECNNPKCDKDKCKVHSHPFGDIFPHRSKFYFNHDLNKKIESEDDMTIQKSNFAYDWNIDHYIAENWYFEERNWFDENYPNLIDSDPDEIMEKFNEMIKIPANEWPKEVVENYKKRFEETKTIKEKYDSQNKITDQEYNFFDHVKSFYLHGETMFDKRQ
jgi:hypothetical protein